MTGMRTSRILLLAALLFGNHAMASELAFVGVACWYYWDRSRRDVSFGGRAGWAIYR